VTARHPIATVVAWVLLLALAVGTAVFGLTGETLFQRLEGDAPSVDGEASHADDVLAGDEAERESYTVLVYGVPWTDPGAAAITADLAAELEGDDAVTLAAPFGVPPLADGSPDPRVARLVAEDGEGFLITATVEGSATEEPPAALVDEVLTTVQEAADDFRAEFPDATVEVGGSSLIVDSILAISENDLRRGETVALPIALVVMLIVFGGFIAAGVPLVGAGAAIGGGLGILFGVTLVTDIDTTVINVVTAVGLGLSIDYGLLMVSRFREEYRGRAGVDGIGRATRLAAIARTAGSAGRTVVFSGVIFLIASAGLLVFEPRMVRAVGLGAMAVTLIAIVSALTLIPALLSLTGDRLLRPGLLTRIPGVGRLISRFGDVAPKEGFFSKLTRRVQRHPAIVTIACALALIIVGSPIATLRLANTSVDATPSSSVQYDFIRTLETEFPDATTPRVALVTQTEADGEEWGQAVADLEHVASVGDTREVGEAWQTDVRLDDPQNGVAVVGEIRADRAALQADGRANGLGDAWVTGTDARTTDLGNSLLASAPWAVLILALGTIVLMFLMTGSLVIPIKALVASALSLGASIGVLVWGFEMGNFAGIMGFDASTVHGVDVLVLLLTFIFGFGLAMDYEMFILSRIKEQADAGVEATEAIAIGLQRSGRIITSAALIIIVVFAGFATGDLMVIKQLGTALAVAVLLDATLVRCLLVPAFMTWQRRIMWWAPRWMKRLHARFGLTD
jgi:RND superfamily putative drug exporter